MLSNEKPGRFTPLLITLAVMFISYPILAELEYLRFFQLFLVLVLLAAVYSQSRNRRHLVIAILLVAPSVVFMLATFAKPSLRSALWANAAATLFLGFVTFVILKSVLRVEEVEGDTIAGSISVYLLLGLTWGTLYGLIEYLWPGSFNTPEGIDLQDPYEYSLIYYSFVTLTTLGYGDYTPTHAISQAAAWMEAVVGQLFVAILIARLVAQHVARTR
jgi:hypothetical protein